MSAAAQTIAQKKNYCDFNDRAECCQQTFSTWFMMHLLSFAGLFGHESTEINRHRFFEKASFSQGRLASPGRPCYN